MVKNGDKLVELIKAIKALNGAKLVLWRIEQLTKLHYSTLHQLDAEQIEMLQRRQN